MDWESTVRREAEATLYGQLGCVLDWLSNGGDAQDMVVQYWRTRDVDAHGSLSGPLQEILSGVDVTTDAFWPDDDRGRDHAAGSIIGERELRTELLQYVRDIQRLGWLRDWRAPGDA